ncbi:hypothetical protein ABIB44_000776 [Hymenobacter sp. UYCo722]
MSYAVQSLCQYVAGAFGSKRMLANAPKLIAVVAVPRIATKQVYLNPVPRRPDNELAAPEHFVVAPALPEVHDAAHGETKGRAHLIRRASPAAAR